VSDGKKNERERGKDMSSTERCKNEVKTDKREKGKKTSSAERSRKREKEEEMKGKDRRMSKHREKKRSESTGLDELGEEERDIRNMAEIQRRIERRRVAKELKHSRAMKEGVEKSKSALHSTIENETSQKMDTGISEGTGSV